MKNELQDYIKSINPNSDILINNSKYHCWRNDTYIGIYEWVDDENIGGSFQQIDEHDNSIVNVAIPTRFELIINKNK
jgi:hypothetical protein